MRNVGFVVSVLLASAGIVAGAAQAAVEKLDGTQWMVTVTPDGAALKAGEKPMSDTLIFKDGQLTSTACVKAGFAPSAYTPAKDVAGFTAEQASDQAGKTAWSGQVSGDTISGTMVWTKTDGQVLNYLFTGKQAETVSAS